MGMDQVESLALKFQLNMLSDWHVGSGYGRPGDVDALVIRDADGLPYIPAKTLTGILRDACEQVAYGLDEGQAKGAWSAWVDFIFGSQPAVDGHLQRPISAALSVRPAVFPDAIRRLLSRTFDDEKEVSNALRAVVTFVKPGVKLDTLTGQSDDKCLRMEEMARGGAILTADARMNISGLLEDQPHCVLGLLTAGCLLAERIGGKRRRGGGKIEVHLCAEGIEQDSTIKWLAENSVHPPAPPPGGYLATLPKLSDKSGQAWSSYDVTLKLNSPIVAASHKKGNVVESLDYLPGTYLLPVIPGILRKNGVDADSAIVNGDILVSNATVDIGGERGFPVPWALFREKLSKGEATKDVNVLRQPLDRQRQFKGLRAGYVNFDGETLTHKKVQMLARMHNSIDDSHQRPDESLGGVYTYMAIGSGQLFHARIRVSQDIALPEAWEKELIGSTIRLGSSKKDDYGIALITGIRPATDKPPIASNEYLTVWLTSDVLLHDDRLRPAVTPEALHDLLQRKLGCKLTALYPDDTVDPPMNLVGRRHRTDSWQTSWGLPRPSLVGLCAGTCLIYKVTDVIDAGKLPGALATLQVEGIGERRAEGFGQVQFNHPVLDNEVIGFVEENSASKNTDKQEAIVLTQKEEEYLKVLKSAALTAEIRRAAAALAADPDKRRKALGITEKKPTDSQLGNLRAIMTTVNKPNEPVVMAWLTHNNDAKNPMADKWDKDARDKLQALFGGQYVVWSLLEVRTFDDANSRWAEAVRTLLDQCIRFEKRDREKSRGGRG